VYYDIFQSLFRILHWSRQKFRGSQYNVQVTDVGDNHINYLAKILSGCYLIANIKKKQHLLTVKLLLQFIKNDHFR
jgi:hypothetical protein